MLTLNQLLEIERQLSTLSDLIDQFQVHDYRFQEHAMDWLQGLENVLDHYLPNLVPEIATLRAEVVLAEYSLESYERKSNATLSRRKRREAVTANAIRRAGEKVIDAIRGMREVFNSGEQIAQQIAAVAKIKGITIQPAGDWNAISNTWDKISADSDLISIATHLVGMVGRTNAILLYLNASAAV